MRDLNCYFTLTCSVLLILGLSMLAQAQLVGHWTFEDGVELVDLTGNFDDLTLTNAEVKDGQLHLDVDQLAITKEYSGPEIVEKTLVSWLYLEDLDAQEGSALTTEPLDIFEFDGIVYGEREPHRWCAGSGWFHRTEDFDPGFEETETDVLIQMAISYEDNNGAAHVRGYRNRELIGDYEFGEIYPLATGNTQVLFGARFSATPGLLDARIEEARVYAEVLSQDEIQGLTLGQVSSVNSRGKLTTLWGELRAE